MSVPPAGAPASARITSAGLLALVALEILWETRLAPLSPTSAWFAVKALPLAALLPGTYAGRRRARQWLALLLPLYAAEAAVRAWSEPGRHALVATAVCVLAIAVFGALLVSFRHERRREPPNPGARPGDGV